ncbi:hypothetical protein AB0D66_33425 [Streptomyces sp. NPDC048270]|uniref:hypothetical protein n=1 Tax=Streptomyces sp. NPDC048270 TaxID=3154615 RepID=UPI0033E57587
MAAIGCAYGPATNCGLGLYQTGPDSYVIASPRYDENDNSSLPEDMCMAEICTDLWAYSIADLWTGRLREATPTSSTGTVVDVPPGTYEFTHHSGEPDFNHDAAETVFYAHIKRIA